VTAGEPIDEPAPIAPKQDPEKLVLRARPQPVVRFRRGLIVGITGAVAASLVALAWVALDPPSFHLAAKQDEADEPFRKPADDALAGAPKSYGDVPKLGPPLPGDLGRPILEHERSFEGEPSTAVSAPSADAAQAAAESERRRTVAAEQAARAAGVLVQLSAPNGAAAGVSAPGVPSEDKLQDVAAAPALVPAAQQRKIEFARSRDGDINPHELTPAPSPWTLSAGTMIPASLVTGLNSDLPGMVIAQVTVNVSDSATGRTVLVPQGARLIGSYDSVVAYGQRRALLVWQRIVFPDGSSVRLDNMPATDSGGYAGLQDKVDSHGWQLLKGVVLSTLLGVGTQLSLGSSESDLVRAIRESAQQNAAHAGDQITSHNLDIQPTLKVRPGWPVRVLVNKDLVLRPWRG
jgi:type IV secretion system protein VirB10